MRGEKNWISRSFIASPNENWPYKIDSLTSPNWKSLSVRMKKHFISRQSECSESVGIMPYQLNEGGDVISGKVTFDVKPAWFRRAERLADGLKVHSSGVLFATGPGRGFWIISPEESILALSKQASLLQNCAFDAEEKYLYITADNAFECESGFRWFKKIRKILKIF